MLDVLYFPMQYVKIHSETHVSNMHRVRPPNAKTCFSLHSDAMYDHVLEKTRRSKTKRHWGMTEQERLNETASYEFKVRRRRQKAVLDKESRAGASWTVGEKCTNKFHGTMCFNLIKCRSIWI